MISSEQLPLMGHLPTKQKRGKFYPKFFDIFGIFSFVFFVFAYSLLPTPYSPSFARAATAPNLITYQGKLLVGGLAATTTQSMKFVLYDAASGGTALYTASGTLPTTSTVSVTPTNGLFTINFGEAGTNSVDPAIFQNNASVYLEVTINGETLSPRKPLTSAPYAFNAKYLDGVGATSTASTSTYIPVSDANGNFVFNEVTSTKLAVTGNTNLATTTVTTLTATGATVSGNATVSGAMTLATTTASNLAVNGGVGNPRHKGSLANGAGGALLGGANSVFVSGNYAYVGSNSSRALEIVDISNPASPVHKGSLTNGSGGALLNLPNSVFVSGNYAYVTDQTNNALEIVDISNPASPVHKGSLTNGSGGALLATPLSVFVSGNYAYVASFSSNALEIIDISNPANPVHKGSIIDGAGGALLAGPHSVFVSRNYAYVTDQTNNALEIVDISNPANPVHKGSIIDGAGGASLNGPFSVFVSGNYAYIASYFSSVLEIIDISNPAAPVHKGSLSNGAGGALLNRPNSVFVSGNYAYVASRNSNALEIVDVSNPASPVHKGSLANGSGGALLTTAWAVFVSGNYAYVATSGGGGALEIIDITGVNISNAQIGALNADTLQVGNFAQFNQGLLVNSGLDVGGNALFSGDIGVLGNTSLVGLFTVSSTSMLATTTITDLTVTGTCIGCDGGFSTTTANTWIASNNFTGGLVWTNATGTNAAIGGLTVTSSLNLAGATISGLSVNQLSDTSSIAYLTGRATQTFDGLNVFSATTTMATTTITSATITNANITNLLGTSGGSDFIRSNQTYTLVGNLSDPTFSALIDFGVVSGKLAVLNNAGYSPNQATGIEVWQYGSVADGQNSNIYGIKSIVDSNGGTNYGSLIGGAFSAIINDNISAIGVAANAGITLNAGAAPTADVFLGGLGVVDGSATTTAGLHILPIDISDLGTGSITTSYGIKIEAPGFGNTQWTAGFDGGNSYFTGNTIFGASSTPGYTLDVQGTFGVAGTSTLATTTISSSTITTANITTLNGTTFNPTNLTWVNATGTNTIFTNATATKFAVGGVNNDISSLSVREVSIVATDRSAIETYQSIQAPADNGSSYIPGNFTAAIEGVPRAYTGSIIALSGVANVANASTASTVTGGFFAGASDVGAVANLLTGAEGQVFMNDGTITDAASLVASSYLNAGSITRYAGLWVKPLDSLIVPGTSYGIRVDPPGMGTAQWTVGVGTGNSYMAGNTIFGASSTPGYTVDVRGTLSVSGTSTLATTTITGRLGINTSTPTESLDVVGNIRNLLSSGYTRVVATASVGLTPTDVEVSGRFAYVANNISNTISILDISNPPAPVTVSSFSIGALGPARIKQVGKYLYVTHGDGGADFLIYDISNKLSPTLVGSLNVAGTQPYSLEIYGKYAYIANYSGSSDSSFSVIDISNPANPVTVATTSVGTFLNDLKIKGKYAYIVNNASSTFHVLDISNPAAPIQVATTSVDEAPTSLALAGRYAYVGAGTNGKISVVDISNPNSPLQINLISIGAAPSKLAVSGRYLYSANYFNNTLKIFDLVSSTNPVLVDSLALSASVTGAYDVKVVGRYAYIPQSIDNTLVVVDISGTETNGLIAHSAEVGGLQVLNDARIRSNLFIDDSLIVGLGGILSSGALAVSATSTTSTFQGALQIYGLSNLATTTISSSTITQANVSTLSVSGSSNLQTLSFTNATGTNFVLTGTLNVTGTSTLDGPVNLLNLITFNTSTSATTTGNAYQIGLTTDSPNKLIFNTPTSSVNNNAIYMEWRTGGVSRMSMNSIGGVSFGDSTGEIDAGDIALNRSGGAPGYLHFGNTGNNWITAGIWNSNLNLRGWEYLQSYGSNQFTIGLPQGGGQYSAVSLIGDSVLSAGNGNLILTARTSTSAIIFANGVTDTEKMRITADGLVGIGTTNPSYLLSVSGTLGVVGTSTLATTTFSGQALFGTTTNPGTYQVFIDSGASTTAGLGVNGYIKASGFITESTTLDLAEQYPIDASCYQTNSCPEPGDAVCVVPNIVPAIIEKCSAPYSKNAIGIISTAPGFTLGGLSSSTTRKVALAGRVPLRVSLKNGSIQPGDKLTTSDIPGVAIKAAANGPTIGIALESFNVDNQLEPTILAFVNRGENYQSIAEELALAASSSVSDATAPGSLLSTLLRAVLSGLRQIGVTIGEGIVEAKRFVAGDELCINQTCVTENQLKQLLNGQGTSAPAPLSQPASATYSPPLPDALPAITTSSTSTDPSPTSSPAIINPETPSTTPTNSLPLALPSSSPATDTSTSSAAATTTL